MIWVLRLVLLLIVVRIAWRFVLGLIDGMVGTTGTRHVQGASAGPVPLVKDPVCGTYVVRDKALTVAAAGHTLWFCSRECRDRWLDGHGAARS